MSSRAHKFLGLRLYQGRPSELKTKLDATTFKKDELGTTNGPDQLIKRIKEILGVLPSDEVMVAFTDYFYHKYRSQSVTDYVAE